MVMGKSGIIENVAVVFIEFFKANAQLILFGIGNLLLSAGILLLFGIHVGITIGETTVVEKSPQLIYEEGERER